PPGSRGDSLKLFLDPHPVRVHRVPARARGIQRMRAKKEASLMRTTGRAGQVGQRPILAGSVDSPRCGAYSRPRCMTLQDLEDKVQTLDVMEIVDKVAR